MNKEEQQIVIRIIIESNLRDILWSAKKGYKYITEEHINELFGSLLTLSMLKLIDEQTCSKCMKLSDTIRRKYYI